MPELIKSIQLKIHNFSIKNYFLFISLFFIINFIINNKVHAIEPKQDPKYGNGQSASFIKTMYGSGSNVTENDLQTIKNTTTPDNINSAFIRLGANNGTSSLTKIKNTSVETGMNTAIIAKTNQTANSKYGGEIGLGYRWDRLSLELELMATENMKYNVKQLFSNKPGGLNSVIKAQGIFINSYYDFIGVRAFRVFFGIGFGAGINRTNSNFFNSPPFSTGENYARRRVAGAYNLVLGCKLNIAPPLFISAAMRYTNFAGFGNIKMIATSNVEWRDERQNLHLEGQHTLVGFSISLIHIFL